MTTATGDLPDTLTYHDRRWFFMGLTEPADGVLIVQQYRGSRAEVDRYRVEEQPAMGAMGRAVLLAKQTGNNPEVYETVIGPVAFCNCKAAKCKVPNCRHRDCLAAMVAEGVI